MTYALLVDRPDGRRIGTLPLLAARSPRSLVYLPLRATAPEPWFGRGDETPLDPAGRPFPHAQLREVRLRRHEYANTLMLTGGSTAFRNAAREIFAVARKGPSVAAEQGYQDGGCNYHVCRGFYDPMEDPFSTQGEPIHVEFANIWAARKPARS